VPLVKLVDGSDTVAAVAEPQRSPARERLAQAIEEIARRQRDVAEAAKPAQRLEAVIRGHDAAKWRWDLAKAGDRQRLAAQIADGGEAVLVESTETEVARQAVARRARDRARPGDEIDGRRDYGRSSDQCSRNARLAACRAVRYQPRQAGLLDSRIYPGSLD
jgi:hypothetical protein